MVSLLAVCVSMKSQIYFGTIEALGNGFNCQYQVQIQTSQNQVLSFNLKPYGGCHFSLRQLATTRNKKKSNFWKVSKDLLLDKTFVMQDEINNM